MKNNEFVVLLLSSRSWALLSKSLQRKPRCHSSCSADLLQTFWGLFLSSSFFVSSTWELAWLYCHALSSKMSHALFMAPDNANGYNISIQCYGNQISNIIPRGGQTCLTCWNQQCWMERGLSNRRDAGKMLKSMSRSGANKQKSDPLVTKFISRTKSTFFNFQNESLGSM